MIHSILSIPVNLLLVLEALWLTALGFKLEMQLTSDCTLSEVIELIFDESENQR